MLTSLACSVRIQSRQEDAERRAVSSEHLRQEYAIQSVSSFRKLKIKYLDLFIHKDSQKALVVCIYSTDAASFSVS